jgi:RNA ligase
MNEFLLTLNQYYEDGLLYKQTHPTLPLTIWNYTPNTQYSNLWDDITTQCRGLVTDNDGNVVARPLKKFFNIEEDKHTPTEEFEVYEKMDGSLGILFNYEGEWILSTRGSFTSEQSVKGRKLLEKYDYNKLHPDYTYLFEIIYSENRIVCRYDFEDLILLGMIHTKSGYEVNIHSDNSDDIRFKNLLNNIGINIVKRYDGIKDYTSLKSLVDNNAEGFVVRFSNGDRMKIKGEEYIRLHRIMTNISTTGIWEMLSNGDNVNELLKDVPDEFYQKIKKYADELKYDYYQISEYCGKYHDFFRYGKYNDRDPEPTKKEFAEYVMKQFHQKHRPVMFAIWDKKPYDQIIWEIIKPEFKKL